MWYGQGPYRLYRLLRLLHVSVLHVSVLHVSVSVSVCVVLADQVRILCMVTCCDAILQPSLLLNQQ